MDALTGFSAGNALFAIGAGFASTISPCVPPVLPIVMAGQPGEHRLRPVAIVSGLMTTFVLMGILSSLLGASLGLVWIPCVGPFLSSILAMVAARAQVGEGAALLVFCSAGFSLPKLVAAYASQAFRQRTVDPGQPVELRDPAARCSTIASQLG